VDNRSLSIGLSLRTKIPHHSLGTASSTPHALLHVHYTVHITANELVGLTDKRYNCAPVEGAMNASAGCCSNQSAEIQQDADFMTVLWPVICPSLHTPAAKQHTQSNGNVPPSTASSCCRAATPPIQISRKHAFCAVGPAPEQSPAVQLVCHTTPQHK